MMVVENVSFLLIEDHRVRLLINRVLKAVYFPHVKEVA
jgi:hypothetical protein